MEIIDTQIHRVHPAKPWNFEGKAELVAQVELVREAMDCVGVDRAVLNDQAEFCDMAISRYPDRFATAFNVLPESSRYANYGDFLVTDPDVERQVTEFRSGSGHLALRTEILDADTRSLAPEFVDGRYNEFLSALAKHSVPLFVFCSGRAESIRTIAETYPELQIIVDHLGLPQQPMRNLPANPWEDLPVVISLGEFPNVAIKLSGAQTLSKQPYPHHDVWPKLHLLLEAFGTDRLIWASDFTRLRFAYGSIEIAPRREWAGTYGEAVSFVRETDELSVHEKAQILSGNARRLLNWNVAP